MENTTNNQINKPEEIAPFDLIKTELPKKLKAFKKSITKLPKRRGYVLLILILMYFAVGLALLTPIVMQNNTQLKDTQLEIALDQSENIAIATTSPIRNYITNEIYKKAQQQFIEHLNLNKSPAPSYPCQNTLTLTQQNGGSMLQQYGLCNPSTVTDTLQGDSNQHIDFLSYIYPNYDKPLDDKYKDATRKAIIDQAQNTYSYTLHSVFIGEEVLQSGTARSNRYRWLVRADVETHTYFNITNQIVMNFDVVLDDTYYPGGFDGAGTNCDALANAPTGEVDQVFIGKSPDGSKSFVCVGSDCQPLGVTDDKGFHPYGSEEFKLVCGTDPYCGHKGGVGCGTQTGSDFQCNVGGGSTYVGAYTPPSVRPPQKGCASERTGQLGVTGIDPDGYTFTIKTRLVSIGSTYN